MRSLGAARARAKRCPRRLSMPAEAQSREPLSRFLGETQIAANDPERAECEGQGVTLAYEIGAASSSTPLRSPKAASASSLAAGCRRRTGRHPGGEAKERAQPRRDRRGQGESQQRRLGLRWPSDHRQRQCRLLEPSRVLPTRRDESDRERRQSWIRGGRPVALEACRSSTAPGRCIRRG
jgi:hypothetical protein